MTRRFALKDSYIRIVFPAKFATFFEKIYCFEINHFYAKPRCASSPHAQHVVPLYRSRVPDEEDPSLPLGHQEVGGVLTGHGAEVPAGKK